MDINERWRPVKGYEGIYEVSDKGNVVSLNYRCKGFRHPLSKGLLPIGYYIVVLAKDKIQTTCYVHRLVAEAFIPNPQRKPEVNHIDSIRTNNCVSNLEWVTSRENVHHALKAGRLNTESGWRASVEKSRIPVDVIDEKDNIVISYPSLSQAARAYGVRREIIKHMAQWNQEIKPGQRLRFAEKGRDHGWHRLVQ